MTLVKEMPVQHGDAESGQNSGFVRIVGGQGSGARSPGLGLGGAEGGYPPWNSSGQGTVRLYRSGVCPKDEKARHTGVPRADIVDLSHRSYGRTAF